VSDYMMLRWAVGDEQVDRALATVIDLGPDAREEVIRCLAAGDTIDAAGKWTPAERHSIARLAAEWCAVFAPCEALRSRDPGAS
jgi:hypothetical protein